MTPGPDAWAAAERVERDAWLDLFAAAPPAAVAPLGLSSSRVGGMGLLASGVVAMTEFNRAMGAGVDGPPTDADLRWATDWLRGHAAPCWAIQASPALGGDAAAMLARRGLAASGSGWAKFVMTDRVAAPRPVDNVVVVPADAGTADAFGRIPQSVFGLPEAAAAWFAVLVGRSGWHAYLAAVEGEYAGAGALFVQRDGAWLGIGATLPAHRKRGVQRALLARRVAVARAAGASVLTAETAEPAAADEPGAASYRNCLGAGFERAYARPNYRLVPSDPGEIDGAQAIGVN